MLGLRFATNDSLHQNALIYAIRTGRED